jgi:hypothetical protein
MNENNTEAHIMGLHEDLSLSLLDIKNILLDVSKGKVLGIEEKMDGQNFSFTVSGGVVRYAGKGASSKRLDEGLLDKQQMLQRMPDRVKAGFSIAFDTAQDFIDSLDRDVVRAAFCEGKAVLECSLIQSSNPVTLVYPEDSLRTIRFASPDGSPIDSSAAGKILSTTRESPLRVLPKPVPRLMREMTGDMSELDDSTDLGTLYTLEIGRILNNSGMRRDHALVAAKRLVRGTVVDHKEIKAADRTGNLWGVVKEMESTGSVRAAGVARVERMLQKHMNNLLSCFDFSMPAKQESLTAINENVSKIVAAYSRGAIKVRSTSGDLVDLNDRWRGKLESSIKRIDPSVRMLPVEGIVFRFAGIRYKVTGMYTPYHRLLSMFNFEQEGRERLVISG